MSSPAATRAKWTAVANQSLPKESQAVARNRAITARYARWYTTWPDLYKWSALAVAASLTVGRYLKVRDNLAMRWAAGPIEALRCTSDRVFADVGWVHAAFVDPDGGMAAVEHGLADMPDHAGLLEGFRLLERGRNLPRGADADDLIWRGAETMLHFEQWQHVQPHLGALPQPFRAMFSMFATADYADLGVDAAPSHFALDVLGQGFRSRLPDLGDFSQRWYWIERHVLPRFRAAERSSPKLQQRMQGLSAAG